MAGFLMVSALLTWNALSADPISAQPEWMKTSVKPRKAEPGISSEFEADSSYVGNSMLKQGSAKKGDMDGELQNSVNYVASIPAGDGWRLRVGAAYERYDFGLPAASFLPDHFQSTNAVIGADVNLSDKWLMRLELHPGVYSDFRNVRVDDLNIPAIVGFSYLVNSRLQWFLGLGIDPRFGVSMRNFMDSPVFPGVGVRWQFADDWTLMALLPKPEIQYKINEQWEAFAGAELMGGNYRMNDHFGDQVGRQDLNNEMLSYREIRTGLGLRYKFHPAFTAELNGGYVVDREFRFGGRDLTLHTDPAPYGALQLKANF